LERKASHRGDSLALFAGGPFWALEEAFERVPGVDEAVVGYVPLPSTGADGSRDGDDSAAPRPPTDRTAPGKSAADTLPDFDAVVQGGSGHAFAVRVRFDPGRTSYADLLRVYLRNIDPTARDRQFTDSGSQYRTLILTGGPSQEREARAALDGLARNGRFKAPLAVAVAPAEAFLPAGEGRQDHYRRYPGRYQAWLRLSGRSERLRKLWGAEGPAGRRAGKPGHAGRPERFPRGGRSQDSGRSSR
jgi:peptide-methionine (S)-S-oxide reductase